MNCLDFLLLTLAELRFDPNFMHIPFLCCPCITLDSYLLRCVSFYGESKIHQEKGKSLRLLISTCGHYINIPEARNVSSCPTAEENLL